jgi:hypothetical protein
LATAVPVSFLKQPRPLEIHPEFASSLLCNKVYRLKSFFYNSQMLEVVGGQDFFNSDGLSKTTA